MKKRNYNWMIKINELESDIRARQVVIRKFKSAYHSVAIGDTLHFDLDAESDVMALSKRGLIGIVSPDKMPEFDINWVLWQRATVQIEEISGSGTWLITRFVNFTPNNNYLEQQLRRQEQNSAPPPEPPGKMKDFSDRALYEGANALMEALYRRKIIKRGD